VKIPTSNKTQLY